MAGAAQQIVEMSTHLHVGTPDGAAAGAAADDDLPEGFDNMRACRLWLSGFKGETTTLVTLCASIDPRDALDLAKELVAHSGLAIGGGAEGAGEVASAWAKGEAVISFLEAWRLAWESLAPEDVLLHEVRTLLASLLVSGGGAATVGQRARAVRQLITACTCRAAGAAAGWRDDAVLVWAQQQLELGSSVPHTNARQLRGLRKTLMQVFVALAADSPAVLVCRVQAIMDWGWALCQKGVLLQDEYATVIEALIKACKSSSDTDQAALVQHILTFLQPTWQMENSHLNSIEAFVAHYILPRLEQAPVAEGGLQTNGRAAFAAADVRLRLHMQVQLVTAAVSTASSNAAAQAVLAEALAWVVPGILALICCLHAMWRPDVRSQLSSKAPALYAMSAAEWTTYAGRPDEAPSCRHADLSGDSVDDVRLWMEIILHMAYHAVVEIAQLPVQVDWQPAAWLQGERLSDMGHKQLKLYLRQCLLPLVRFGHPATVKELVLPLVSEMLKSLPGILLRGPQPQQQPSQLAESGAAAGGGSATGAEVVSESLMRELARAALCIVSTLVGSPHTPARVLSTTGDGRASSTATQPRTSLPDGAAAGPFPGAEPWATTPAAGSVAGDARGAGDGGSGNGQGSGGGVRIVKAGEEGGLSLAMLLQQDAEAARNGVDLAVLGLELPDGECLRYATGVCEELIRGEGAAAAVLAQIRAPFVVPRVLNGILKALAAAHASPTEQADMIRISTTIFQQQWPTARGVLVSLGIEPEMVDRLRAALDATPSLKQQRTVVKQFFAQACSIALPASGSSASLAGPQQATVPEPSRKPVFVQPPGGADEAGAGHGVRALFP